MNKKPPTQVMIDLETLGTKPGCVILSIGACTFNRGEDPRDMFYQKISLADSYNNRFTVSQSTMDWWDIQPLETKREAFSGVDPLALVLENFVRWIRSLNNTVVVWSKAASFDLKILEHTYHAMGYVEVPWNFRNEMCFRTLQNLYSPWVPAPAFIGVKHNALDDAINQAIHAEMIYGFQNKCVASALALVQARAPQATQAPYTPERLE